MKPRKARSVRERIACEVCSAELPPRNRRFCSHECQRVLLQRQRIEMFQKDLINPVHTVETGRVPRWIRAWWVQEYGELCAICGWSARHPRTGKVPLEWDHIDGDCSNNRHSNLRLLCPNCHSLTENHGVLNYGKSRRRRKWAGVVVIQRAERGN
jgi:predicted nucleic acid-binding Zn ribbon protein